MDKETKLFLGKILGEIYTLQNHINPDPANKATIYGLLNGIEEEIDQQFEIRFISNNKTKHVADILEEYFNDPEKEANFQGFYDIEHALKEGGVSRSEARIILTWLNAHGHFTNIIEKMDSPRSPSECKKFDLKD